MLGRGWSLTHFEEETWTGLRLVKLRSKSFFVTSPSLSLSRAAKAELTWTYVGTLGRQGWRHLVDLLVDGVQLGDLRRPLFSSGKVVGLGHQLQHLHACEYRLGEVCIGEWELFWNFALQMLDCNKINYRLKLLHWIIDHTSKVLYISFLFCWSRKVHLGIGVNIFLDENLPVVGVARVVHQSALINVTLHQVGYQPPNRPLWSPWNLQNRKGRQLLCLQPIHLDYKSFFWMQQHLLAVTPVKTLKKIRKKFPPHICQKCDIYILQIIWIWNIQICYVIFSWKLFEFEIYKYLT